MISKKHFKRLKNGDILPFFFSIIPLLIWLYFCMKIPIPWLYSRKSIKMVESLTIFIILIPILNVLYNFYSSQAGTDLDFNTAEETAGWEPCLTVEHIDEKDIEKGLVGYWDNKCGLQQLQINNIITQTLVNRFYYISNALFIFIIVIYNSLSSNILKNRHITETIIFCLLMGILGMLPAIFSSYYLKTMFITKLMATILAMNISAFFLLIIAILDKMKRN